MAVPYQVFLSYSSQDKAWADAACARLEERRIGCWIAPRDITPGTEWGAAIIDGIDKCELMVLIFSSGANASVQVRREVERALSKGLAILPLRVEDVQPSGSMEYALSNTHWLDAFAPSVTDPIGHMADSVSALLGEDYQPRSPTGSFPVPTRGQRSPARWIALSAVLGIVALIALGIAVFNGLGRPAAQPDKPRSPIANTAASNSMTEEISKFQGRWKVMAEHTPARGPVPDEVLERKQGMWRIHGNTLVAVHHMPSGETTITGTISMRTRGRRNYFDFDGYDNNKRRLVWSGIYEFKDKTLNLAFNVNGPHGDAAVERAASFPDAEDRGSFGLKLHRLIRGVGLE